MSIEDKERKERILTKAEELFQQHGYSKVTMEEIAADLGVSKKTLYHFFPNKRELMRELMTDRQVQFMEHIDGIWGRNDLSFLGKVRSILDFASERASEINKLPDIQRVEPELWRELHDFKKGKIFEKVRAIIEAGFETGVFRSDVDKDILLLVYMHAAESIVNQETLSELPCTGGQAFEAISKIIFEGILTEEGRTKYIFHKPLATPAR